MTSPPSIYFAPSTQLPLTSIDDGLTRHNHDQTTIISSITSESPFIRKTAPQLSGSSLHIKNHPAQSIIPSSLSSKYSFILSISQDDSSFQQEGTQHTEISKRDHDASSESLTKIETQTGEIHDVYEFLICGFMQMIGSMALSP
jgi:hypothetical protein